MKRLNGCSEVKCDEGQESRLTLRYLSKWKDKNLHLLVWGNWWRSGGRISGEAVGIRNLISDMSQLTDMRKAS